MAADIIGQPPMLQATPNVKAIVAATTGVSTPLTPGGSSAGVTTVAELITLLIATGIIGP
jgi:hypothetical protein